MPSTPERCFVASSKLSKVELNYGSALSMIAWAAEIARWNPNLYFDISGSSLIKKQDDPTFWKSIFWWSGVVSPHTPPGAPDAFEKLVFGSDVFNGELEEFDRELERYHKMLDACGVPRKAQENILSGTLWRILNQHP